MEERGEQKQMVKHMVKLKFIHQTSQNVGLHRFKTANDVYNVPEENYWTESCAPTPLSSSSCSLLQLTNEDYKTVIGSYKNFCHAQ